MAKGTLGWNAGAGLVPCLPACNTRTAHPPRWATTPLCAAHRVALGGGGRPSRGCRPRPGAGCDGVCRMCAGSFACLPPRSTRTARPPRSATTPVCAAPRVTPEGGGRPARRQPPRPGAGCDGYDLLFTSQYEKTPSSMARPRREHRPGRPTKKTSGTVTSGTGAPPAPSREQAQHHRHTGVTRHTGPTRRQHSAAQRQRAHGLVAAHAFIGRAGRAHCGTQAST